MSIRLRLTLLYMGVLAVTLVIFSAVLYFRVSSSLHQEIDRSLSDRVNRDYANLPIGTGDSGGANAGGTGPRQRPNPFNLVASTRFGDPTVLAVVVDGGGQVVARSQNVGEETLPVPSGNPPANGFRTVTVRNVDLRMYVRTLPLPAGRSVAGFSPPFTVLVARPLGDTESTLDKIKVVLLLGIAGSLALAGGSGWLLARNALRPIDELTAEAQDIGRKQDFKRRVAHDGPEDEVGRLAGTFNQMLASLDAAHDRLRRALDAQRRFVADASHELRTPLTTIRGNVELLRLEQADAGADQQEALGDIASETERMSRLVNNLLALARADSGLHIAGRPVEVQPVLAEVFQKAQRMAGEIDLRLGESVYATVSADRDYLLQLLFILVDNAIKYTAAGGTVTLSSSGAAGSVRIAVSDTGVGISREDQAHVFDRFYRVDPSRHGEGTGLGLSIARWIAEELDGRIELQSEPGKGSTFTVILPALPGTAPAEQPDHVLATGD
jgi:signal transduction histidine kinase